MRMFFQSLPSEQPEPPTFDIYYTRPAGSTYGNGNGGSYENAFSGFSLIPWSNLQNKQLIINGNHLETLNVGASNLTIKGAKRLFTKYCLFSPNTMPHCCSKKVLNR